MKKTLLILLFTLFSFAVYFFLDDIYFKSLRKWFFELTNHSGVSHILTYTISGIPLFIATYFIARKTSVFESLGLNKSIFKGFLFALVCTLPLFIGFSFLIDFNSELSLNTILISVVAAGSFEELFYRGFLFGILFKYTRLGFIPSVFLGALFFGLLHLYQSTVLAEMIGIFLITFIGGLLFAWVYAEWNYNIWTPIFLHMFMNLSWELFSVSDTALGGMYANMLRLICIVLVILFTILYKKKKGVKLEINKNTILIKKYTILVCKSVAILT